MVYCKVYVRHIHLPEGNKLLTGSDDNNMTSGISFFQPDIDRIASKLNIPSESMKILTCMMPKLR